MSLSIYIKAFHGVIAIGDFILKKIQILLKIICINKRKLNHSIEGMYINYLIQMQSMK